MITFPPGVDLSLLVSDVVSLAAPFVSILLVFLAYKGIRKALKGGS